jgi:hypothetical protein
MQRNEIEETRTHLLLELVQDGEGHDGGEEEEANKGREEGDDDVVLDRASKGNHLERRESWGLGLDVGCACEAASNVRMRVVASCSARMWLVGESEEG